MNAITVDRSDATLWSHFILAAAVARGAAAKASGSFCYVDTHAGSGAAMAPTRLSALRGAALKATAYADAVGALDYPGSWVLAGRVARAAAPEVDLEFDVNDLDEALIAAAQRNREAGRVRFWSHDWFLFLRSRLGVAERPDFVFIDPPADDPRGPAYAIDAAILLDALNVPYMLTYPVDDPQAAVDQIGRTGLELHGKSGASGALLGGGAEQVVLHLLPDLRTLAGALDATLNVRLPKGDDYCI